MPDASHIRVRQNCSWERSYGTEKLAIVYTNHNVMFGPREQVQNIE